jgi:hypothetical protein
MNIIVLATAWGPKFGGINAFNEDFVLGLGAYVAPAMVADRTIFCLVPDCSAADVATAALRNVRLVEISEAKNLDPPFAAIADTLQNHPALPSLGSDDVWVGHDDITGAAAVAAARASGSRSALIMHMNYEAYKFLQDDDIECERRSNEQRALFKTADICFAVGPLLRNALKDMTRSEVHMLVPGLSDIEPQTATTSLRGIAFGRLDERTDIVKQARLVAACYGRAIYLMRSSGDHDLEELPPSFKIYGASSRDDAFAFHELADEQAEGVAPLLVLPFSEIRGQVFDALARANLAIVPSLHDGFALTGWEAIAAETPLILSRSTGLWKLLNEYWSPSIAKGFVKAVLVHGQRPAKGGANYSEEDVDLIASEIVDVMRHRTDWIRVAADLKRGLQDKRDGCTWEKTAEDFLVGLGLVDAVDVAEARFTGDWVGYFIEGSTYRAPEVVRERISVVRAGNGKGLRGSSTYEVGEEPRREELKDLSVHGGVLGGHTAATSGYTRDSWCQFQVAPRCNGQLMEGVVTWSSTVETVVDWSRYIWVKDMPGNKELRAFAEREMLVELELTLQRINQRRQGPYPVIEMTEPILPSRV